MLKVYCLLTICVTKWQLHGLISLTYFTNCLLQWKRSAKKSWRRYHYFCMTMHLLTGHMLNKLLCMNPAWKKLVIYHILLIWHRVITKFDERPLWTEIFHHWWAQVHDWKSRWRSSQSFSILHASKNSEIVTNCALTSDEGGDYVEK